MFYRATYIIHIYIYIIQVFREVGSVKRKKHKKKKKRNKVDVLSRKGEGGWKEKGKKKRKGKKKEK